MDTHSIDSISVEGLSKDGDDAYQAYLSTAAITKILSYLCRQCNLKYVKDFTKMIHEYYFIAQEFSQKYCNSGNVNVTPTLVTTTNSWKNSVYMDRIVYFGNFYLGYGFSDFNFWETPFGFSDLFF